MRSFEGYSTSKQRPEPLPCRRRTPLPRLLHCPPLRTSPLSATPLRETPGNQHIRSPKAPHARRSASPSSTSSTASPSPSSSSSSPCHHQKHHHHHHLVGIIIAIFQSQLPTPPPLRPLQSPLQPIFFLSLRLPVLMYRNHKMAPPAAHGGPDAESAR